MSEYSKTFNATLVSVHVGKTIEFIKDSIGTAQVELDGFVGDKHRSYMRGIYEGEAYEKVFLRLIFSYIFAPTFLCVYNNHQSILFLCLQGILYVDLFSQMNLIFSDMDDLSVLV